LGCENLELFFRFAPKGICAPFAGLLTLKLLAFRQCFQIWLYWMAETWFRDGFDTNLLRWKRHS